MAELEFPIIYRPLSQRVGLVLTMACFPCWGMVTIMTFSGNLLGAFLLFGVLHQHNLNAAQHLFDALLSAFIFLIGLLSTLIYSDSRITISKSGIMFPRFMLPVLGWRRQRLWSDLSDVLCVRPESFDIKKQKLTVRFRSGHFVNLDLSSMQDDDASRFLLALDVWGSSHLANTEHLEKIRQLTRTRNNPALPMFTEMWESELHHRFGSLSYVPLEPGDRARSGTLQIVRQLNFGGHSAVYLALQDDKELVVLKESVAPTFADEGARRKASEMFEREAALLMRLSHHCICRVFDNFVEDGRHYLLLEYIHGRDLRQIVRETGPKDEQTVLKWAMQIASVLEYMHGSTPPIIHRDVTPDNIVLKENGDVTVVDFGAANEFLGTATGTLVGKQAYIAPEQFRGKATMQSDIYALGGTLFFALTGQDPEPLSVSHPKQVVEEVSEEMDHFVALCTELDVDRRLLCAQDVYSHAKRLIEEVESEITSANR